MLVFNYPSKKVLKASIGKRLLYIETRGASMKLKTAITKADKITLNIMNSDASHFGFKITKAEARRELEEFLEYDVPGTTESAEDIWMKKISCGAFFCELMKVEGKLELFIRLG